MKTYVIRNTSGPDQKERVNFLRSLVEKQVPHLNIEVVCAEEQRKWLVSVLPVAINLDPFSRLPGHVALDVCRVFGNNQGVALRVQERPGAKALLCQIEELPSGRWVLMDDDICTGTTVTAVVNQIHAKRSDIEIVGTWSLIHEWWRSTGRDPDDIVDVIDSHDFIPGQETSGLVVETATGLRRTLYSNEAVDLKSRALFKDPEGFRKDWETRVESESDK